MLLAIKKIAHIASIFNLRWQTLCVLYGMVCCDVLQGYGTIACDFTLFGAQCQQQMDYCLYERR